MINGLWRVVASQRCVLTHAFFLVGVTIFSLTPGSLKAGTTSVGEGLVRHAPTINGRVEGSLQQLLPEGMTLNGGGTITGNLRVPGTPVVRLNGKPTFGGTTDDTGLSTPSNYQITLNGGAELGHVVRRTNPISLLKVAALPSPAGTRDLLISSPGQTVGNFATLRNLTLNGNTGQLAVPPGTYGDFIANGNCGFTLGVAGVTTPTVYNFQRLTLNGASQVVVVGPVIVNVAYGFTANGHIGATQAPSWLTLNIYSGDFTLNSSIHVWGMVSVPNGQIIVNANSELIGGLSCDRLLVNGAGLVRFLTAAVDNQAPIALAQSVTLDEDVAKPITLTGSDADGDPLVYTTVNLPAHGTLSGTGQSRIYTPAANYFGSDSFSFKVNDGTVDSSVAVVSLTISPVNDRPTADAKTVEVMEDISKTVILTGVDVDGDPLTFLVTKDPLHGSLQVSGANVVYTPVKDYNGPDRFEYVSDDGTLSSVPALVTIIVDPANDAPIANSRSLSVDEGATLPILLTASDVDGDPLSYTVLTSVTHGTLSGTAPNLSYRPDANYGGIDTLTFKVNDGTVDSAPATITIQVTNLNDAPSAQNAQINLLEDTSASFKLKGNDPDGNVITFTVVTRPTHGVLTGTAPDLVYTPDTNFNGVDSLTFKVKDSGNLESAVATVILQVQPVNDAPVANPQSFITLEDKAISFSLTASDDDGDPLTYIVVTQPQHGSLSGSGANRTYTPALNFNGSDVFTFKVNDRQVDSAPVSVDIEVVPVNDPPVALPQAVATNEDVAVALLLAGTDVEGSPLTYAVTTPPIHGKLTGDGANRVYTPDQDFPGPTDSFEFTVNDGDLTSAPALVTITVRPINDAPVATDQTIAVVDGAAVSLTLAATDVDSPVLAYTVVTAPTNGTLSGTAPNLFFTPALGFSGSDFLNFKANDGLLDSNVGKVVFTISVTNHAPIASDQNVSVVGNTSLPITLTGSDPDNDVLKYVVLTNPAHGDLSGAVPNLIYTPSTGYQGPDSFTFKVNDTHVDSNTATVVIAVGPPANRIPVADAQSVSTIEDTPKAITLTGSDPDGTAVTYKVMINPTHGNLSGTVPILTYTPDLNYSGDDSFSFTVNDGAGDSLPAVVSINIAPVNDAPVATGKTITIVRDSSATVHLDATDPDGDFLHYTILTQPVFGSLTGTGADQLYTPAVGYTGSDSFTFKVDDGQADSAVATIGIVISPTNRAPIADSQSVTTREDISTPISLTASDPDGNSVSFTVLTSPSHGDLSASPPNLTYKPAANYNGPDSFTFKVNDGQVDSAPATVSISVAPVNDAPVANSQSLTLLQGSFTPVTLTATDPDGDPLTYTITRQPKRGSLSGTPPNLVYTGGVGVCGSDDFAFIVSDGKVSSNEARVDLSLLVSNTGFRSRTYTTKEDFEEGRMVNLSASEVLGQLRLDRDPKNFDAVWVPIFTKGTIVRIDAETGRVLGEYRTTPGNGTAYPSRTAIDSHGNVWVANEQDGSVTMIANPDGGDWVDRNHNGVLDTSSGLDDVKPWTNEADVDSAGGVSTTQDELITRYVKVSGYAPRHLSIDLNDNLWVGGGNIPQFDLISGKTGQIIRSEASIGRGGNGGFINFNGILYSAGTFLRWDTSKPLSSVSPLTWTLEPGGWWGTAEDPKGNIWVTRDNYGFVEKYDSLGRFIGRFSHHGPWQQGIAIGADGDVWIAHSHCGYSIAHLKNDGTWVGEVPVANHGPTGVSIDRKGRIWSSNTTGVVQRINPLGGPIGEDGKTPVGEVDITSSYLGGTVWAYSNFTGQGGGSLSTLKGRWAVVYDSCLPDATWGPVSWNAEICNNSQLVVSVATSNNSDRFGAAQPIALGETPVASGQYLQVIVEFVPADTGEAPILHDISVGTTGYVPPPQASGWSIDAGKDFDAFWPDPIVLHGAVCKTVNLLQQPIAVTWSKVSGPGTVNFDNAHAAQPKCIFTDPGEYILRLTGTDGTATYTDDVKLVLTPHNKSPWVDAGAPRFLRTADTITLKGVMRDDGLPLNTPVTTLWKKKYGPGDVTFADPSNLTSTATFSKDGIYVLELSASDTEFTAYSTVEVRIGVLCSVRDIPGMVSWWTGNYNSEEHVNGNQAFPTPGVSYIDGIVSGAFSFNGTTGSMRVFESATTDIGKEGAFTIDFWGARIGYSGTIMIWGNGGVQLRNVGYDALEVHLMDTTGLDHVFAVGIPAFYQGRHVALTYDKATGRAKVYLSGELISNQALGSFTPKTSGDLLFGTDGKGGDWFNGWLDEVTIYNRALTQTEILPIYYAGSVGKCPLEENQPPAVSAGPNKSTTAQPYAVNLDGVVADDGEPDDSSVISHWTQLSGPGTVTFGDASKPATSAVFSAPGLYVLQLEADDTLNVSRDTMEVRVDLRCNVEAPAGLVAWWPGNANTDELVHGHNLVFGGQTTYVTGAVSMALSFDGDKDWAQVPAHSDLDIGKDGAFTIEFWGARSGYSGTMMAWGNGGVQLRNVGYDALEVHLMDTTGLDHVITVGLPGFYQGRHVALTYDKTTKRAKVYLSGALVFDQDVGSFTPKTSGDLWFGTDGIGGDWFNGWIDEITFYNRALTQTEILPIYYAGNVGKCPLDQNVPPAVNAGPNKSTTAQPYTVALDGVVADDGLPANSSVTSKWTQLSGPGTVTFGDASKPATSAVFSAPGLYVLQLEADDTLNVSRDTMEVRVDLRCNVEAPAGLVAWWPGNANTDELVHGHNLVFGGQTTYVTGAVSMALSFDGDKDWAQVPAHSDLDIGKDGAFTIEFWGARSGYSGTMLGWGGGVQLRNIGYDNLEAHLWDTTGVDHMFTVALPAFYQGRHVALTYDKTTRRAKVYLSGALIFDQDVGSFTPKTSGDLWFGTDGLGGDWYNGWIDEVTFYNRALTQTEILPIYYAGNVGKCPLDQNVPPAVNAGPNKSTTAQPYTVALDGVVADDGLPVNSSVTSKWTQLSGPGTVTFGDASKPATSAVFSAPGLYVLQLEADDTLNVSRDTMEVRVDLRCDVEAPAGLVAWWPGNANTDELVHGHNLVFGGQTTYVTGAVSMALSFDGDKDWAQVPAHSDLDIGKDGAFTIEFWGARSGYSGTMLGWGGGVQLRNIGYDNLEAHLWDTTGVDHMFTVALPAFYQGRHVALTYDKTTGRAKVYLSGALVFDQDVGSFTPKTSGDLWFGTDGIGGDWFNGWIDEITFYNRALTQTEIMPIYFAGSVGKCPLDQNQPPAVSAGPNKSITGQPYSAILDGVVADDGLPTASVLTSKWTQLTGPGTVTFGDASKPATSAVFSAPGLYVLQLEADDTLNVSRDTMEVRVDLQCNVDAPAGLVAWWPGNANTNDVVHGHNLTLGGQTRYITGAVSMGLLFDGDQDWAQVPAHSDLDIGKDGAFTIEFWGARIGYSGTLLGWNNGGVQLRNVGYDNLEVHLTDTTGLDHMFAVALPGFYQGKHVALIYETTTGHAKVYLSGALVSDQDVGSFIPNTTGDLYFGTDGKNGDWFNGWLDEITFYNRALTPAEIVSVFNAGACGKNPLAAINQPPAVNAGGDQTAPFNAPINLTGTVVDDGLPAPSTLTYSWTKISGPGAVTFSAPTAPTGLATVSALGTYVLRLSASDGALSASDDVSITVVTAPLPPTVSITSPAEGATVISGIPFTITADAADADGTVFKVEFLVDNLKVGEDTSTPYSFTLTSGLTTGAHTLTARAFDNSNASTTSTAIHITAQVDTTSPTVSLTAPSDNSKVLIGRPFSLAASASDAAGIAKVEFYSNGTKIGEDLTAPYTLSLPGGLAAGDYIFDARATDNSGLRSVSNAVHVSAVSDTGVAPLVEITSPADSALITAPTVVTGTASSLLLSSYTLEFRPVNPDDSGLWTKFAGGSNSVINGTLGTFDPTSLRNGPYEIRLNATDTVGRIISTAPLPIVVDGKMKVGHFTVSFKDLSVPVAGIPIEVVRTYDSRDTTQVGDFGPGWSVSLNNIKLSKNRRIFNDWFYDTNFTGGLNLGVFYWIEPVKDRIITITFPDDTTYKFKAGIFTSTHRPGDQDNYSYLAPIDEARVVFYPVDARTHGKLEPLNSAGSAVDDSVSIYGTPQGPVDLLYSGTLDDFNPDLFKFTTDQGDTYILSERDGLRKLTDRNGNTLTVTRDGITSVQKAPTGDITTGITFHRDSAGKIDYIRDPAGQELDYLYDAQGRLTSFANREANITQFRYENPNFPYYLTKIIDPLNRPALRTEYGDDGRVSKQIDADGKETLFDHGTDATSGRFERVKDRLGHSTTFFYDTLGNVTLKVDPLGAKTSFQYYPDSERAKYETDHYGNVKSMAYDARENVVVETIGTSLGDDPSNPSAGYTTRTTYDAHSNPTSMIDAQGRATTFVYDQSTGSLLSHTAGANLTDPSLGQKTTYTYTSDGQIETVTDALGNVTSYTYQYGFSDSAYPGAVKKQTVTLTDPVRGVLRVTSSLFYAQQNQVAQIATRTLPSGTKEDVITSYRYDKENRLRATIHPDGRVTEVRYIATGQEDCTLEWRSVADFNALVGANARIEKYFYDTRGNRIKTRYPDSSTEESFFDEENRRVWSQDRLGRRTFFAYDDVGRLRFTIYPNANDGVGAAAPVSPADSRLADNARSETVYDLVGRVTKQIDERGTISEFVYYADGTPDASRRKEVHQHRAAPLTDLVTSYQYDKSGAVRFVTDPRGATTETRYDEMGRVQFVVYPATDEHPSTQAETRYDTLGRRAEVIDTERRSTKFAYDGLGRLLSVTDALNQTTSYTYDEMGNQLTQTDANGHVTSYETDNMGRRTKRILPKGSTEATALYEQLDYDEWGNLWHRRDFAGYKTAFAYDTINRLKSQSADPAHPSLIYSHAIARVEYDYDANSARTAARTYNASNVQLYVEATPHTERGWVDYKDTPYGRLDYDYYDNGLIKDTVSSNASGVNLGYRYDALNRLEHVDDGTSGTIKTTDYSYNANGSLETVLTPNGIKHSYTYDALNRLRNLTISNTIAATTIRTYDYQHYASGHRRKIVESNGRTAEYTYDALYRLKQELITGDPLGKNGIIGYDLDPVGNRKSRTSSLVDVSPQSGLTYNARDWLDTDTYDANGNTKIGRTVLSESPGTDTYDFQNRLILRRKVDGSSINIAYDADGNRIQKTILNAGNATVSSTTYLVDTNNLTGYAQVVEERTAAASGTTLKVYAYGSDLISQTKTPPTGASSTSYYAYDGLASVRFLTSAAVSITDSYDYDAFGNLVTRVGATENAYLYRGEQFDADLGLYYNRARYLNQNSGRFWSMDEYEGGNKDPGSLHKYLYANADPVMGRDPSGNMSLGELGTVGDIIGELGNMATPYIRIYYQAQRVLETVNLIREIASGDIVGGIRTAVEDSLNSGGFKMPGFSPSEALAAFERNLGRLTLDTGELWTEYLLVHGASVNRILVYMPAPFHTPIRELPTKIKVGRGALALDLKLVFGTNDRNESGRVGGLGIGLKSGDRQQIWRMDYHARHVYASGKGEDAWVDDQNSHYNFHVKYPPGL